MEKKKSLRLNLSREVNRDQTLPFCEYHTPVAAKRDKYEALFGPNLEEVEVSGVKQNLSTFCLTLKGSQN